MVYERQRTQAKWRETAGGEEDGEEDGWKVRGGREAGVLPGIDGIGIL